MSPLTLPESCSAEQIDAIRVQVPRAATQPGKHRRNSFVKDFEETKTMLIIILTKTWSTNWPQALKFLYSLIGINH